MIKEYHIADGVLAFSTTRKGGVSEGNYGEFNINEYCGDELENVAENRKRLADALGIAVDHIILPHQVHGVEVRQIGPEYFSMPENHRKMALEGVDAVMTDLTGVCVGVSTADCIPVLLYDEAHHAVAAIHAGWRGTQARIVLKAVQEMSFAYHTDPKKLKAVIGPGISLGPFEVGDEVYEAFQQADFDMRSIAEQRPNAAFHSDPTEKDRLATEGNVEQPLKWHINLPLCNLQSLLHLGVKEENVVQSNICTYEHVDEYFSARKLGIKSGRIYTAMMLR